MKWIKRYIKRRRVIKRLIEYAKTKEGYEFILKMNKNNLILADYDCYLIDGKLPCDGITLRIKLPKNWNVKNEI